MVRGDADGSLLVPGPKDQSHTLLKQQVDSWSQPACQPGQGEAALAASFNLSAPALVSAGPPGPAAPPADASSEYAWIPLGRPNGTKKVDDANPISPGASVRRAHANEPAGAEIERGGDAVAALRPPALDTTAVSKGGQGSNVTSSWSLAEAWSEGDYALAEPTAYAPAEPPATANAQAQPARSNVLEMMKPTDKSISQVATFSLGQGNVTMATPTKSAIDHAMLAVQSVGQVKGGVVNTGSPLTSGALEGIISHGHVPGIVTPMVTRAEGLMSGSKKHEATSTQGHEDVSQAVTVQTKSECEHGGVVAGVMSPPPPPPPPNAPPPEDVDSKMMLEEAASLLFDLKNSAGGYRKKELPEIGLTLPPDTIVTPVKWPDANSLTKPHVDTFFGVNVKKEKFERMLSLYKVLCGMHHQGIAIFETDGGCNVFGFSSVSPHALSVVSPGTVSLFLCVFDWCPPTLSHSPCPTRRAWYNFDTLIATGASGEAARVGRSDAAAGSV